MRTFARIGNTSIPTSRWRFYIGARNPPGGVFLDDVFGWMVHVYPFENDVAKQF